MNSFANQCWLKHAKQNAKDKLQFAINTSDVIFTGRAVVNENNEVTFSNIHRLKGKVTNFDHIGSAQVPRCGCQYNFVNDAEYLVFALIQGGLLVTNACEFIRLLDDDLVNDINQKLNE